MVSAHVRPSRRRRRAYRALVGLAAAATALTGVACIAAWPDARALICGPTCQDRRFAQAMAADGHIRAGGQSEARRAVSAKLKTSPFDTGAWLRLAVLEAGGYAGVLTRPANLALEQSYRFAPIDVHFAKWRLAYVFSHWRTLSPVVRSAAVWEATALYAAYENRAALQRIGGNITDPSGALAFQLLMANLAP